MRIEMLLAALTARPVRIGQAGRGGRREVTKDMIAAALSGLPEGAYYLIESKFMGERETEKKLALSLINHLISEGYRRDSDLETAVCLAIREAVDPNTCTACNGNPRIFLGTREEVCHVCEGSGVVLRTDTGRARAAGVSESKWLSIQRQFRDAQNTLSRWEAASCQRLIDNLKEEGQE